MKNSAENYVGTSQRKLAKKFEVSRPCIQRILKKIGLKYYKRLRTPKYTRKQLEQIPGKCRKLCRELTDQETFIIVDDEKYFTFSSEETSGNASFYSSNRENTPDNVKFKSKQKFEPKILVSLSLSSKGISTPFIGTTKGSAMDTDVYIRKRLLKLLKFIEKHHLDDKYIFCSDLASSHYAHKTSAWLNEKRIPFVPKVVNPLNVPKVRPIEDFWSILADKMYSGG